jgi:hypothetical protein
MPWQSSSGRSSARDEPRRVSGLSASTAFSARTLALLKSLVITLFFSSPVATSADTFLTRAPNSLA